MATLSGRNRKRERVSPYQEITLVLERWRRNTTDTASALIGYLFATYNCRVTILNGDGSDRALCNVKVVRSLFKGKPKDLRMSLEMLFNLAYPKTKRAEVIVLTLDAEGRWVSLEHGMHGQEDNFRTRVSKSLAA